MTDTDAHRLTPALTLLMAVACGVMVANIYYAQTLIALIGPEIHLSPSLAGAIVTLTQLGYGVGLALLVPLSDRFENKRLILLVAAGAVLGCLGVALSNSAGLFLAASLLMGLCSVGGQILVPLATNLSSPERQGRTIGLVMSGLLTGIMLARPVASFVAEIAGWRAMFLLSAALVGAAALALALVLPERRPERHGSYAGLVGSMLRLMRDHRTLRLRTAYQALLFLAFNLFWTAAPLVLLRQFHFSQAQVGWFALAGAGGALVAPVAGQLADRGHVRRSTLAAFLLLASCFALSDLAVAAGSVLGFAATAVAIDAAVQLNQISGQRLIFALDPAARGRINASYMTIMFVVGAMGSLVASSSFEHGGWSLAGAIGAGIGCLALALFALFDRKRPA